MEAKQKINAKLNLNLYIKGVKDGYHEISSFVTSVGLYDAVTVKERSDGVITLETTGEELLCAAEENNAYKAALAFKEAFGGGCDVKIEKGIPVGKGLGGSSADICGVIKCLAEIYGKSYKEVEPLLKSLGSDTVYMYKGGFAKTEGRGNDVEFFKTGAKMHFILALPDFSVNSGEAYRLYDEEPTENVMAEYFYNALYAGVAKKYPVLKSIKAALEKTDATGVSMTGSGSCMFAVYAGEKERDVAFENSPQISGVKFIKTESV